jgi:hypothetical protein
MEGIHKVARSYRARSQRWRHYGATRRREEAEVTGGDAIPKRCAAAGEMSGSCNEVWNFPWLEHGGEVSVGRSVTSGR